MAQGGLKSDEKCARGGIKHEENGMIYRGSLI